jgi:hypothetical protein
MTPGRRRPRVLVTPRGRGTRTTKQHSTPRLALAANPEEQDAQGQLLTFPQPDGWSRLGDVSRGVLLDILQRHGRLVKRRRRQAGYRRTP